MKAYFVGSISGRKKYLENYKKIIETLERKEYEVLEDTIEPSYSEVYDLEDQEKEDFYKTVNKWIGQADVVVAEISYPSVGVGYEISLALNKGKPVIVLSDNEDALHFIDGIKADKLVSINYSLNTLENDLDAALDYTSEQQDTRFNFFISPKHQNYLDWIAKNRKVPRAVFLRRLIEDDMEENEEFTG